LARAVLESTAFQVAELVESIKADDEGIAGRVEMTELRVDGGMVVNDLLMQFQADLLGIDVVRPRVEEATALGAAYAAGLAEGVWDDTSAVRAQWTEGGRWRPNMDQSERERLAMRWSEAVKRSLDWS
tara:strand:+ start:115 stop:498 length:384 start_codon:yes stop_codon:yes gene_type:complete